MAGGRERRAAGDRRTLMPSKRVLIIGGVAGGASCAVRLRRMDERADIVLFERSGAVSFANCGLPYYLGGVIADRSKLLVATPERFRDMFRIEVRTRHEVRVIDRAGKTIRVKDLQTGAETDEAYDYLVLAPGAAPVRPPLPGIDLPGVFILRNLDDTDRLHAKLSDLARRGRARLLPSRGRSRDSQNFVRLGRSLALPKLILTSLSAAARSWWAAASSGSKWSRISSIAA